LRLAATASTSLPSAALNRMFLRSCIPRTHTRARQRIPKRIENIRSGPRRFRSE
jgi:hypothetical protein